MLLVSDAYKKAMHEPIQKHRVRGLINNTLFFNESHIVEGSFSINNKCVNDAVGIGAAYIGELRATFIHGTAERAQDWINAEIAPQFYLCTDELNDRWEAIQLGIFHVVECNITAQGFEVVAYDNMALLDKPIETTQLNGNIYAIATTVCLACGVHWGLSVDDTNALVNGPEILGYYDNGTCLTYRDVISSLAQVAGGFATADRRGNIVIKNFSPNICDKFNNFERYEGASFSNYVNTFSGFYIFDEDSEENILIGNNTFATLDIGANAFLQYGEPETKERQRRAILAAIRKITFSPFECSFIGNPVFELGDALGFTDGLAAGISVCCIMAFDWQLNGFYTCQGFGANETMENAPDSGGSSGGGTDKSQTIKYLKFANVLEINAGISGQSVKLASLKYGNSKLNTAELWLEANIDLTINDGAATGEVMALYYLDGELESYKPTQIYNVNGKHILTLNKYIDFEEMALHTLDVWLTPINCTFVLPAQTMHGLLKGQGINELDEFDGLLQINDTIIELFNIELRKNNITENVNVKFTYPVIIDLLDVLTSRANIQINAVRIVEDAENPPTIKCETVSYIYVCGDQYFCSDDFLI